MAQRYRNVYMPVRIQADGEHIDLSRRWFRVRKDAIADLILDLVRTVTHRPIAGTDRERREELVAWVRYAAELERTRGGHHRKAPNGERWLIRTKWVGIEEL